MNIAVNYKAKNKRGICATTRCSKYLKSHSRFCSKHYHVDQKERRPYRYWYDVLKDHARRRNKVFTLTLEEFIVFCNETGYLDKKGIKKYSYGIDRINDELGYVSGNLQLLTNQANARKQHQDKKLREQYSTTWDEPLIDVSDIVKVKNIDYSEVPF